MTGEMADEWEDRCRDAEDSFRDGCRVFPPVSREVCPKCGSRNIYECGQEEGETNWKCRDCDYDEDKTTEAGGLSVIRSKLPAPQG